MRRSLHRATVAAGGRGVIPAAWRKALGIKTGDEVMVEMEGREIRLYSRLEALRRVQERVAGVVPRGVSLVEELIRERRKEAARE
ncbi:MAG: AbrB/MazE/SpoVT family DNA-binding domain-containing protein [Bryobacteraceae bacterium]